MEQVIKRRGSQIFMAVVTFIIVYFLLAGITLAARPYFKMTGGDVMAGGWFNSNAISCVPKTDQLYQSATSDNSYKGGILAYANYSGGRASGASSELGAFSLGLIEGRISGSGEPYGFYTGSGTGSYNKLSFGNNLTVGNYWGGFFERGTDFTKPTQTHCIWDYFATKKGPNPNQTDNNIENIAGLSGQYINSDGFVTISSTESVAAGKKITVFIDGDAYINKNITYAARSTYNFDNIPKLVVVVKGNIYIDRTVTQLDGLYIAQPDLSKSNPDTAPTGIVWTCHDGTTNKPTNAYVASCTNQLTVNGALIAKQVNLMRVNGDIGDGNVAEVINFTPEMILGGAFFNQSSLENRVESLVNLPPVL